MDWTKCIICQKTTKEKLQCPANTKRKDTGAGYISFLKNVQDFQSLERAISVPFNASWFDLQTLSAEKASWHKSCRDMFSNTKLQRAKKRQKSKVASDTEETEADEGTSKSPIKARRSSAPSYVPEKHCFFCDKAGDLHAVTTLEVDQKVRECVLQLKDNRLIAKLSAGDLIAIDAMYHAKCLTSLYNQARQFKSETATNMVAEVNE